MEKDDEVKGNGNSYTTDFRQYDARLGRWLSIDPLYAKFPWQSPYVAFDNNPVYYNDPKGLSAEGGDKGYVKGDKDSRKRDNKDGTQTYDAPGFTEITIPDRAVILSTMQDSDNDGTIDYNNKPLEASEGDLRQFKIDNVVYTANFVKGHFTGYFSSKGVKYVNKVSASNSNNSKGVDFDIYAEMEAGIYEDKYGVQVTEGFGLDVNIGSNALIGIKGDSDNGFDVINSSNSPEKLGIEAGWYSFGGQYNYELDSKGTTSHTYGFTFLSVGKIEYRTDSKGNQTIFIGGDFTLGGGIGIAGEITGKTGLRWRW